VISWFQSLLFQILKLYRYITVHGNPVEELPNYRLHVPSAISTLRSLDFIGITRLDRDKMDMFDRSRKAARERYESGGH
jgi:hypothetical protein